MSSEKKVIAVCGATGAQGGGLISAILADTTGQYTARALTRDPNNEKGQALAAKGVQVVAANLDDEPSLVAAFTGAYGVYGLTNWWEHFSSERELQQAQNIASACRKAGVKHIVWSTLEDTRPFVPLDDPEIPTIHGKYKCAHFDSKGEANAFFSDLPTTLFYTSFYMDNLISFGMGPRTMPDGSLALTIPLGATAKLPVIVAEDIGKCAFGVLTRPELIGQSVGIACDQITGEEFAAMMSVALRRKIVYANVPHNVYRTFGFPGAEDIANMFAIQERINSTFCSRRPVAATHQLAPGGVTWAHDWLANNASRIQIQ